jgi:hypothetical protein
MQIDNLLVALTNLGWLCSSFGISRTGLHIRQIPASETCMVAVVVKAAPPRWGSDQIYP